MNSPVSPTQPRDAIPTNSSAIAGSANNVDTAAWNSVYDVANRGTETPAIAASPPPSRSIDRSSDARVEAASHHVAAKKSADVASVPTGNANDVCSDNIRSTGAGVPADPGQTSMPLGSLRQSVSEPKMSTNNALPSIAAVGPDTAITKVVSSQTCDHQAQAHRLGEKASSKTEKTDGHYGLADLQVHPHGGPITSAAQGGANVVANQSKRTPKPQPHAGQATTLTHPGAGLAGGSATNASQQPITQSVHHNLLDVKQVIYTQAQTREVVFANEHTRGDRSQASPLVVTASGLPPVVSSLGNIEIVAPSVGPIQLDAQPVIHAVSTLAVQGGGVAQVTIHPQTLGSVTVQVAMTTSGAAHVLIQTTTAAGHAAIDGSLAALTHHLTQSGVVVGSVRTENGGMSNAHPDEQPSPQHQKNAYADTKLQSQLTKTDVQNTNDGVMAYA